MNIAWDAKGYESNFSFVPGYGAAVADLFDRPTPLEGENGLADWIRMFDKAPFEGVDPALADELIAEAVAEFEPAQRNADGVWYADYVRLRMRAVKCA